MTTKEAVEIKGELRTLLNGYLNKPITQVVLENIRQDVEAFFRKHRLEDLRFRLKWETDANKVELEPTNMLSLWALVGLMQEQEQTGYIPKCPECFDKGWLYDNEGRRTGICPCHLE